MKSRDHRRMPFTLKTIIFGDMGGSLLSLPLFIMEISEVCAKNGRVEQYNDQSRFPRSIVATWRLICPVRFGLHAFD